MIISLLATNPLLFVVWIIAIVFALTIHEFFHALAGYFLGDQTAARAGRLTLNPISHIDPIGFLMLMFVGIGWAKPVPFNPHNLKYKKWGPAIVALAGPLSNLASFIVIGVLVKILVAYFGFEYSNLFIVLLLFTMFINAILMFFNFIPVPPLDGSKILQAYLSSPKYRNILIFLETRGPLLLLGLLILNWATNGLILSPLFMGTFYMFGFFGLGEPLVDLFGLF
jgi:Zn-dependent protease